MPQNFEKRSPISDSPDPDGETYSAPQEPITGGKGGPYLPGIAFDAHTLLAPSSASESRAVVNKIVA